MESIAHSAGDGKITCWLNGERTVQVDLQSDDWKNRVAGGPMSQFPEFGKALQGHIAFQDWTNGVSFRNVKIREL